MLHLYHAFGASGLVPVEGRQARRGFVPLSRGGSGMVPLCHVLPTAQGCENLPQGRERLQLGLQQNKHLHLFPAPWPAVPRGEGHTWTFCLLSLCSLKSPVLLREAACEFPEAEPARVPGTATWDREQGSCKPAPGPWQTPKSGLVTFSLNTSVEWDAWALLAQEEGTAPTPSTVRAGSSSSTSEVLWHQMLFPGGPEWGTAILPQHFPRKGKEDG